MKNKTVFLLITIIFVPCMLFAADFRLDKQLNIGADINSALVSSKAEHSANSTLLAIGNPNYRVSPGDEYSLVYFDGTKNVTQLIQIDANFNAEIANIGNLSAYGKTYLEFKKYVEDQVKLFNSYAKPVLTLEGCGIYNVTVSGEVYATQTVPVWGLTRLSDLLSFGTEYASLREIKITGKDGKTKSYDLYEAVRNGQTENNPYLEPNSIVEFVKSDATVELEGSVKRPGVYQLKDGESLCDLINVYGDGFTNKADSASVAVSRYVDGKLTRCYVSLADSKQFILQYGDIISVQETVNVLPSVIVQGAVEGNKVFYQFYEGETGAQFITHIGNLLTADSKIDDIYITRDGMVIDNSEVLQEGDVITVPFLQRYVTVTGAVRNPGKFVYEPGKDASYYVWQAGGFVQEARKSSLKVYDVNGDVVDKDTVDAGCMISVKYKDKSVSETIALVSSVVALVSSTLALINAFNK